MRFEWDLKKAALNKKKHGVEFRVAVLVFADKEALSIFDQEYSTTEDRWITMGLIPNGQTLVVVHTDRVKNDDNEIIIRLISARPANKREIHQYRNQNKNLKNR